MLGNQLPNETLTQLKSLLAEGQISEVIEALKAYAQEHNDNGLLNASILQANRLQKLQQSERDGTLTSEAIQTQYSQIAQSLLKLMDGEEESSPSISPQAEWFRRARWPLAVASIIAVAIVLFVAIRGFDKSPTIDKAELMKLANDTFNGRKYGEARQYFSELLKDDPKNAEFLSRRGYCFRMAKDYEHALEDYDKAVQYAPTAHQHYSNRGELYLDLKEYEKALENYNQAIQLSGNKSSKYVNNRGFAKLQLGQKEEACIDFNVLLTWHQTIHLLQGTFNDTVITKGKNVNTS